MVSHPWIYNEGAVCFREVAGPSSLLDLGSELPEVIIVCINGTTLLISADGQTTTKVPMVYIAVFASASDLDNAIDFRDLGGVKKLLSLFFSECSEINFSIIFKALERIW